MTLLYGDLMSAFMIHMTWETVHVPAFVAFVVAVCMGGGYLFALMMWQWKKSLLQASDIDGRKRGGN